jgi:acid-sensing ion channel, other
MVDNNETLSQEESTRLEALYQVCEIMVDKTDSTEGNIVQTLHNISNGFAELSFCHHMKDKSSFSRYFETVITDEGVCYTFNMLNYEDLFKEGLSSDLQYPKNVPRSNWTIFGYENNDPYVYPLRVAISGKNNAFIITLKMRKKDVDTACNGANGFRLAFHTPDELPRFASYFLNIPFNVETSILIKPRVMSTSNNLKNYKPKERQCYFNGEKELKFFKAYTQSNCKLECLTGKLIKLNHKKHEFKTKIS